MSTQDQVKISSPFISNAGSESPSCLTKIARLLPRLRPRTPSQQPPAHPIRIVCTSDTHNSKPTLPPGDILLHSGDLSQYGTFAEIQAQLDWLKTQPHAHKIVIAGNHDLLLDTAFVASHPDRELDKPDRSARDLDWGNIVYLETSAMELTCGSRTLKVFGSPQTPRCGSFAFQYDVADDVWAGRVPDGTDVVMTHGPPALHLDGSKGCRFLLEELWRVQPLLLIFGHIHHARGQETMPLAPSQRLYEAIALGTSSWIQLPLLLWYALKERLWRRLPPKTIELVNASCYGGDGSTLVLL